MSRLVWLSDFRVHLATFDAAGQAPRPSSPAYWAMATSTATRCGGTSGASCSAHLTAASPNHFPVMAALPLR
jgi:hypothetical protein